MEKTESSATKRAEVTKDKNLKKAATTAERRSPFSESCLTAINQERKRFRARQKTISSSSYFMTERVVTQNYNNLTEEQKHALEIDIFKPLDFYGILFNRMKNRDSTKQPEGSSEQSDTVEKIEDKKIIKTVTTDPETDTCSSSVPLPAAQTKEEDRDQLHHSEEEESNRSIRPLSCSSYFMKDRVLTENYLKLSDEQKQALEIDIFKPLDFYEILFNRMKSRDNEEAKKSETCER